MAYSPKEILNQEPSTVSAAIGSVLTTLGLCDLSPFTDKQNLAIVGCLAVLLALFYVKPLVQSSAKLEQLHQATLEAIDLGKQIAPVTNVTNVSVAPPKPPRPPAKASKATLAKK